LGDHEKVRGRFGGAYHVKLVEENVGIQYCYVGSGTGSGEVGSGEGGDCLGKGEGRI